MSSSRPRGAKALSGVLHDAYTGLREKFVRDFVAAWVKVDRFDIG
jgi:catalase (peroxidase I)